MYNFALILDSIRIRAFDWNDIEKINNLKEFVKQEKDEKIKKEISEYVLGQIGLIDEEEEFIEIKFLDAKSLKELKALLNSYIVKINSLKNLYIACGQNDKILFDFMENCVGNILRNLNDWFYDQASNFGFVGKINIENSEEIVDDKYFTELKYPFTLKELTDYRRKIVKIYHPDNGGTKEDMCRLNEIFDFLKLIAN